MTTAASRTGRPGIYKKMQVTARLHWLPKAGNRREEYEDAAWPARSIRYTGGDFRCAVADGATESVFAGQWARQLVQWYSQNRPDDSPLNAQLAEEQRRWQDEVRRAPLPWYAEAKAADGAFAALLGLRIRPGKGGGGAWQALAVGDCCVVHLRGDAVLTSFPATDAGFFDNRPYLVSSHPQRNDRLEEQRRRAAGAWQPGDHFYLMTDALAHWFLAARAAGAAPAALVAAQAAAPRRAFADWIAGLRHAGDLRNDDVTLLAVTVDA